MRLNFWIALGLFIVGVAGFVWTQWGRKEPIALGVRAAG